MGVSRRAHQAAGATSYEALNAFVYWFVLPPFIFIGIAVTLIDWILNAGFILPASLRILGTSVFVVLGSRYLFCNRGASNSLHPVAALLSNMS